MSSITKSSYLQILCSVVYIIISYIFTEQPWEEYRISLFIMICVTVTLTAQACGFLIGVITPFKVCSSSCSSSSIELLSVHKTSGSWAFSGLCAAAGSWLSQDWYTIHLTCLNK